eukprot:6012820-Pleurochrysis_carterae.AAC.1
MHARKGRQRNGTATSDGVDRTGDARRLHERDKGVCVWLTFVRDSESESVYVRVWVRVLVSVGLYERPWARRHAPITAFACTRA